MLNRKKFSIIGQGHKCSEFILTQGLVVCTLCGQPRRTAEAFEQQPESEQTRTKQQDNSIAFREEQERAS